MQVDDNFYCFTVMPFGLCSAPYAFNKWLSTMVKYWRENCIKIVMFLHDWFGMNQRFDKTLKDAQFLKNSLIKAGFTII